MILQVGTAGLPFLNLLVPCIFIIFIYFLSGTVWKEFQRSFPPALGWAAPEDVAGQGLLSEGNSVCSLRVLTVSGSKDSASWERLTSLSFSRGRAWRQPEDEDGASGADGRAGSFRGSRVCLSSLQPAVVRDPESTFWMHFQEPLSRCRYHIDRFRQSLLVWFQPWKVKLKALLDQVLNPCYLDCERICLNWRNIGQGYHWLFKMDILSQIIYCV